jgi:SAM-dependent methyltransferase
MSRHPLAARLFAREVGHIDALGAAGHRRRLLDGIAGRVLEIGAGTGISFDDYPPGAISELVAVEPEPYLRARAEQAAIAAPIPVTVVDASAELLPFPDASFDVTVAARVLCSVGDVSAALGRGVPSRAARWRAALLRARRLEQHRHRALPARA